MVCIDEPEWELAAASPHFTQVDPEQGKPALFDTEVKVLFNRQYLYVGFFASDPLGKKINQVNRLYPRF